MSDKIIPFKLNNDNINRVEDDYDFLISKVMELYDTEMNSRNDSDYKVNPEQMHKLMDAYDFFVELAERGFGRVEPLSLLPKEVSGGITAYFTLFYLHGEDVKRFNKIVENISAISFDTTLDGEICISFVIPNVYQKIK